MATITHTRAALRIRNADGQSVLYLNGVDPAMDAAAALEFVEGVETLCNDAPVTATISNTLTLNRGN